MTKKQMVLKHLKTHGSITSWEAIELYRATRLSAIIYQLRNDGHNIESIQKRKKGINYVEYKL